MDMIMDLKDLPKVIEDIILDYKYSIEHYENYEKTLMILNYIKKCKKCNICNRDDKPRLIFYILKRLTHSKVLYNKTYRYCYYH